MGCAGARNKQPAAGNAGRCVTRVPPRPPARCAGATTLCASTLRPSSAANAPACAVGERAELRRQTVAPAPPMLRAVTLWCSIYFIAACGTAARTAHSIRSSWRHFQMHGSPASALVRQKLRGQSRSSVGRGCNVPCGQVCGAFLCRLLPGECGVMLVCVRVFSRSTTTARTETETHHAVRCLSGSLSHVGAQGVRARMHAAEQSHRPPYARLLSDFLTSAPTCPIPYWLPPLFFRAVKQRWKECLAN